MSKTAPINMRVEPSQHALNQEEFAAFEQALTAPITENATLKALLNELSPWEK